MAHKHLYAPTKVVFLNMLFSKITWLPQVTLAGKEKQLEYLKEEIRMKLKNTASNTCQQLKFVDAVQALGLAYHFEIEIEQVLQHIHDNYLNGDDMEGDIYNVALQFRLLRQVGYNISCGKNPKDNYHV